MWNLLNAYLVANTMVSAYYNSLKICKTTNEVDGIIFRERELAGNKSRIQILARHLTSWAPMSISDLAENRLCLLWNLLRSHTWCISILDLYIILFILWAWKWEFIPEMHPSSGLTKNRDWKVEAQTLMTSSR